MTADFSILEGVHNRYFETDTVLMFNPVRFQTNRDYDSVVWTIGNDPRRFTAAQVGLFFDREYARLPIRLIVYSRPNLDCHPTDDGRDTITKYLTVIPARSPSHVSLGFNGNYFGRTDENPNDTFTVRIKYYYDPRMNGDYVNGYLTVNNLLKGYQPSAPLYEERRTDAFPRAGFMVDAMGATSFWKNDVDYYDPGHKSISGYGYLKGRDSLIIEFKYMEVFPVTKYGVFRGIRR